LPPCRWFPSNSQTEIRCHCLGPRLRGLSPLRVALRKLGVNRALTRSPLRVRVSSR
jgi:hypothetical protein